ncbi:EF hand family protein [Brugia malayi]|uniref:Bm4397 n=1 Tax=Brugia malayi TaxID=6279 RepID=A0A0H5S520_BRUMA|nr:EF hand family protein [Brugia malayi]CRZ23287.1 Bm4397 [Brugia malayi]VIO99569.1 EF hand family protein [Brugia malayi]
MNNFQDKLVSLLLKMQNIASTVSLLFSAILVLGHQAPSFPDHNAQKPLEVHHQGQIHQQSPPAHPNTPPQGAREFGGEQVKNVEHIKEHLDGKLDQTANMTPEQLQFHYFNMHDMDRNGLLDGLELIKAITHFHEENRDSRQDASQLPAVLTETEIERMLDPIFNSDDLNRDGFISYPEFSKAQKQRDEQMRQQYQQQQQQQQSPHH